MSDLEATVLHNLVWLRKAAGYSQKQADKALNLRSNTIYDIEKGRLKLPFILAVELTRLYHTSLDQLIASNDQAPAPETEQDSSVTPLASLGVIAGGSHPLAAQMSQDPVIVAEIGVGQLGRKPLMELLLANLTTSQQRGFVVDLYRYINSLISADGEVRPCELAIRDTLIGQSQIELTASEKKNISRAFTEPYFGGSYKKNFPREAYRHFLIWILHLVSRIDGKAHFKVSQYIQQVAEHIEMPVSALRYIEEQIILAYQDDI